MNPKLIKDFFSQNSTQWKKTTFALENLIRLIGRGLIFS